MQFISQEQQGAETLFLKCYVHCGFYKEVFVLWFWRPIKLNPAEDSGHAQGDAAELGVLTSTAEEWTKTFLMLSKRKNLVTTRQGHSMQLWAISDFRC